MADSLEDEEEGGAGGAWLVSYADLMTLLFAAFVVLYGITPQGQSKVILGMVSSIRESFVEIPDEPIDASKINDLLEGKASFTAVPPETLEEKAIKKFNKSQSELRETDKFLDRVDVFLQQQSKGSGIQVALRRATVADIDEFGLSLIFMGDVFFAKEAFLLSPAAKQYLMELGAVLKKMERPLLVEGYTRSRPAEGALTNAEIAVRRAAEVRKILIRRAGIKADQVHLASYGGTRPLGELKRSDANKSDDRVEIKVDYGEFGKKK